MKKLLIIPALSSSIYSADALAILDNVTSSNYAYEPIQQTSNPKGFDFSGWKFAGDLRGGYVRYDYDNPPSNPSDTINKGHIDSHGFYIIPKLSILTPNYNGFSAKITVAGATDFGINDFEDESRNFVFDPNERKSFAILQEAYISYENSGHQFLAGAKEIVTPMIDADDWYMLANSFQGAYYKNSTIKNITFAFGYFYKMAGVWDSGANGTQWHSMSDASFVDSDYKKIGGDEGVWSGFVQYSDEHHNLQLWEYYMNDYYNTFFAQYDYSNKTDSFSYDAGLQLIDFYGVGELKDYYELKNKEIDYYILSARYNAKFNNGFDVSLGASFYSDGGGTGDTLGAWGGHPYFANGMIFHFFEAGSLRNANSYKLQVGYDISKLGVDGLWVGARYTYFDLDSEYSHSLDHNAQDDMSLIGLKLSYNSKAGYYFNATYEYVDLDYEPHTYALRLIGGYKF